MSAFFIVLKKFIEQKKSEKKNEFFLAILFHQSVVLRNVLQQRVNKWEKTLFRVEKNFKFFLSDCFLFHLIYIS